MPFNEAGSLHVKRILVDEMAVADTFVGEEAAMNKKEAHSKISSATKSTH